MRIFRYLIFGGLLLLLLGNGIRYVYLREHYFQMAPREPNPRSGVTYRINANGGSVYLSREEWLWFDSFAFKVGEVCGMFGVGGILYLLNQRWKIFKNPGEQ